MITTFKQFLTESEPGTYAGLRFNQESLKSLKEFLDNNTIPNKVPEEKLHVTLLYSRKHIPNFKADGELLEPIICEPQEFTVWETNGEHKEKTRCLILKLLSPRLVERHIKLMKDHPQATFDYPEYSPHLTLSYDIGSTDVSGLDINSLPSLVLSYEYQENLKTDWASAL